MKIYRLPLLPYKLFFTLVLVSALFVSDSLPVSASSNSAQTGKAITSGYSALKLFLEDEQYLTAIRRVNTVVTFEGISDKSAELIDSICDASDVDIKKLKQLAAESPVIVFDDFSEDTIVKATFDSLRLTTAKDLLFETGEFEKNILLSQLNVLRLISHLAIQLGEKETNPNRKEWLDQLAKRYESYYQQVSLMITVSAKNNS
jgi:hypothetical protein